MSFPQIGIIMISYHFHKFQIRRNGEEEVMETDELNYQEVKTHKIFDVEYFFLRGENTRHIFENSYFEENLLLIILNDPRQASTTMVVHQ